MEDCKLSRHLLKTVIVMPKKVSISRIDLFRAITEKLNRVSKIVITWVLYNKPGREWVSAFSPLIQFIMLFQGE